MSAFPRIRLIPTEEVAVIRREVEFDDIGDPVGETVIKEEVRAVVAPSAASELGAERPNGVRVAYSLQFPTGYGRSLRGCEVEVRGERFRVVGDPRPYTASPVPFDMPVEVEAFDG